MPETERISLWSILGAYIIVDSLEFEVTNDLKKPNGRATMHLPFEIYGAISQKPAKVRKKIFKEWNDVFGNYGISCMAETICPSCGNAVRNTMNPINHLFSLAL